MPTSQMVRDILHVNLKFICTNAVFLHTAYCMSDLCLFYQNQNGSVLISIMSDSDILVKL